VSAIQLFFPARSGPVAVDELIAGLDGKGLRPFDETVLELFRELARRISRSDSARRRADLQALGYWLRPSEVLRLRESYGKLQGSEVILVPRGCIFHLPPGNVDLQFVYGWVFSLLQGNTNLIRLSGRVSEAALEVCRFLNEIAVERPELKVGIHTAIFGYEHDDEIGGRLSSVADLRVIWGGDITVGRIRSIPLPPQAIDIVFPDRSSLCLIDAGKYLVLDDGVAKTLVEAFFNDAYVFDQLACASPRQVVWCGNEADSERASAAFFDSLAAVVEAKGYSLEVGTSVERKLFAFRAVLDRPVSKVRDFGHGVTVASLEEPADLRGAFCGGGFFFEVRLARVEDLVPTLRSKDQTLTTFGFSRMKMEELMRRAGSRGLEFGRYWDGYDLLTIFSRWVGLENDLNNQTMYSNQ